VHCHPCLVAENLDEMRTSLKLALWDTQALLFLQLNPLQTSFDTSKEHGVGVGVGFGG